MSTSTRWLIGIAGAVGVIVVASIIVAIAGNGEQEFEAGTPEATIQEYFRAVQDRDAQSAFGYLTQDLRDRCSVEEWRRSTTYEEDFAVRIRDKTVRDGLVEIEVRIGVNGGESPFSGGGYDVERLMALELVDGEWLISDPPWPLWGCAEPPRIPVTSE